MQKNLRFSKKKLHFLKKILIQIYRAFQKDLGINQKYFRKLRKTFSLQVKYGGSFGIY